MDGRLIAGHPGIKNYFMRCRTREKADEFVASEIMLGQPPLAFCTQTALPQVHVERLAGGFTCLSPSGPPHTLWSPAIRTPEDPG